MAAPTSRFDQVQITSPKRGATPPQGWEGFFPYYAGFPESFARKILETIELPSSPKIFDPWNGSGTTTYAAAQRGLSSHGFDLNPVMIAVARARLLPPSEADSLEPLSQEICQYHRGATRTPEKDEPLCTWFDDRTALHLRELEHSIRRHLVGKKTLPKTGVKLEHLSGLAATFYVSLFAVARELVAPFKTTNPTWLKKPGEKDKKIVSPRSVIVTKMLKNVRGMAAALEERRKLLPSPELGHGEIALADTTQTSLAPESVDLVLTSPPYCTRIDYTAATRVELALMAPLTGAVPREISRQMIGTTRVPQRPIKIDPLWGSRCKKFLTAVKKHRSKASEIYYYRTHLDYFEKLAKSLRHTSRALKKGGAAILVIQDSYYKEVHNPLPDIVVDIADSSGLTLQRQENFRLGHSMTGINPHSSKYRTSQEVVEAVLCFTKP